MSLDVRNQRPLLQSRVPEDPPPSWVAWMLVLEAEGKTVLALAAPWAARARAMPAATVGANQAAAMRLLG